MAFLVFAYFARPLAVGLVKRVLAPLPKIGERVLHLLETFLDGLGTLASPTRVLSFLLLTGVYWWLNAFAIAMISRSYGIPIGNFAGAYVVAVTVFAVMLPAGPAFAGTLEAGMRFGLEPFGIAPANIAVVALCVHAIQLAAQAGFAGLGLLAADPIQRRDPAVDPAGSLPVVDGQSPRDH
jgi:uncharacterized membrane protein YbhN (UPF0104 family)